MWISLKKPLSALISEKDIKTDLVLYIYMLIREQVIGPKVNQFGLVRDKDNLFVLKRTDLNREALCMINTEFFIINNTLNIMDRVFVSDINDLLIKHDINLIFKSDDFYIDHDLDIIYINEAARYHKSAIAVDSDFIN